MEPGTKRALGVGAAVLGGLFILYLIMKTPKKNGKNGEAKAIVQEVPEFRALEPQGGNQGMTGTGSIIDPPPPISGAQASSTENEALNISGALTPPPPPPSPPEGINPLNPSTIPKRGDYYRVKKGDTLIGIMRAAGNPNATWPKLVDHPLNAWMPRYTNIAWFGDRDGLPLFKRFDPPGWRTEYRSYTRSDSVFPIVYVPTYAEATS